MGPFERGQLEAAIAAQESLRGTVPDEIVDAAIAGLRSQLGAQSMDRRRRQATILFADIGGFTSMSEAMDAEELTALMDELWSVLDAVVEEHGGRVDKHIGDALMAVWGAETSLEDDPEQTVRAALRLQESLERFRSDRATELAMRIGINTGPVMLSVIGSTGEFTAMGDTVNVASRLEHAAPKNGVLISYETYRHVRGVFDVTPLPPLRVRGKSEPLEVYEVRAEKPRAFRVRSRGVEGVETSLVGRDREFVELQDALALSHGMSRAVVVEVIGEAGIGKSRLLWEFKNWLELQPVQVRFFAGRATSQRSSVPLALVRDVLSRRFEILDSDEPRDVVRKLVGGTQHALEPDDAAVLASWLGFGLPGEPRSPTFPDGARLAQTGRAHLSALLRSFAEDSPVVLVIEDLHWADDASVDVLRRLLEGSPDLPMLLVAATRPSGRAGKPALTTNAAQHVRVVLEPLPDEQARRLIEDILRRADAIPAALVRFVSDRSEGNAFYIEELLKMLIDDGAIDVDQEPWAIELDDAAFARVPPTLTGILQSRLDALPETARQGLQLAAVIGRTFWDDAVSALTDRTVDLEAALDRELIFDSKPSTFTECAEYIFKHALLHEVVYETVLLEERPLLHARAASWLDRTAGGRRDEMLIEIAEHWDRAGDKPRAAELLESAAGLALRSGDPKGCLELVDRTAHLYRIEGIPPRSSMLVHAIRAHCQLGQLQAAADLVPDAIDAASTSGNEEQEIGTLLAAQDLARRIGEVDRGIGLLDEAQAVAERLGGTMLGEVLTERVFADTRSGRAPDPAVIEDLVDLLVDLRDSNLEARAHLALSAAFDLRGEYDMGLTHLESALDISRRSGDRWGQAIALSNLGMNLHLRGDATNDPSFYALAAPRYREAVELAKRFDLQEVQAIVTTNLAQLALRVGEITEAMDLAKQALTLGREMQSIPIQLMALTVHAESLIASGELERGLAHIGLTNSHQSRDAIGDELDRVLQRLGDGHDVRHMIAVGSSLDLDSVVADVLAAADDTVG